MIFRVKVALFLTSLLFVFYFLRWFFKPIPVVFSERGTVTYEQLDEIIKLAEDRTRNYNLILDDIVIKVNEIKQDIRTEWELKTEPNEEARQNFIEEQLF